MTGNQQVDHLSGYIHTFSCEPRVNLIISYLLTHNGNPNQQTMVLQNVNDKAHPHWPTLIGAARNSLRSTCKNDSKLFGGHLSHAEMSVTGWSRETLTNGSSTHFNTLNKACRNNLDRGVISAKSWHLQTFTSLRYHSALKVKQPTV